MAGVKGMRGQKGRPAGAKNKKTVAKERVASAVVSTVAAAVVAKPAKGKVKVGARTVARPGITPKDLLLESMRAAWESVDALHRQAHQCEMDANTLAAVGSAPAPDVQADVDRLRDKATKIREVAALQLEKAEELAVKAAPYEHAKLANLDAKVIGSVNVTVAKF